MSFLVEGVLDDHTLSATLATAKGAFAQAIEWHDSGFSNVTISCELKSYSIVSFALAMASLEIANVVDHAADATTIAIPAQDSAAWLAENDPEQAS